MDELDAVWLPAYGVNDGTYEGINPYYSCDIHQYTSQGKLDGYSGDLDLSRLTGTNGKDLTYFAPKRNLNNYHQENPEILRVGTKLNVYDSVEFMDENKTGETLEKNSLINVIGIDYSEAGTPRLKTEAGYISANKIFTKIDTGYYTESPRSVLLSKKLNVYESVEFNEETKTMLSYQKNIVIDVIRMEYSAAGTPRLRVPGGYISANEFYSTPYYQTNPETIYLTSKLNIYENVEFNEKTKTTQSLRKGSTVAIQSISYTANGTPRLKVEGGYISANVQLSQQYISRRPEKVKLASNLNVYSKVEFTAENKTGHTYKKGETVEVQGVVYSLNGTPRLEVEGGYISANSKFFQ